MRIAVIGDGGWGTTLSILLNRKGHNIRLWGQFPEYVEVLNRRRENVKFLPGVKIPKSIAISSDIYETVEGAEIVVLAVPSQYLRGVVKRLVGLDFKRDTVFLSVAKGIENRTLLRMSEVIHGLLGQVKLAVLSGPTISYEVARKMPTIVIAASRNENLARKIQGAFMTDSFRVYTSRDIIGVELGGALKNIVAIATGMLDGMGFEANTKAGLLARGLAEIARLGVAMGARKDTFYGISGLGDLVTTSISKHGRNRWFGEEVGKGKRPEDVLKKTEMVVEGVATAKSAYNLSRKFEVEMPITEQVHAILYKGKDPRRAIYELMTRRERAE